MTNAANESFFAILKRESFPEDCCFDTKAEARITILGYLEVFDNNKRRHSSLGNVCPKLSAINTSKLRKHT